MDPAGMGWKEAAFAAVVILALYAGFALLRLVRPKPRIEPAAPAPATDNAQLLGLQTEMAGLRGQLDALQTGLDSLRGEVDQLKAARAVSPQYSDALSLAQKGMHAEGIAQACGISVAEAELVRALARGQEGAQ